jgi:DNA-directed RNA polymerase subunit RPC12/RpoP
MVTGVVLVCPRCGADRLIPLTFPVFQRQAGAEVIFRRPMAKCSGCGERIFAKIVARQRVPKSSWVD